MFPNAAAVYSFIQCDMIWNDHSIVMYLVLIINLIVSQLKPSGNYLKSQLVIWVIYLATKCHFAEYNLSNLRFIIKVITNGMFLAFGLLVEHKCWKDGLWFWTFFNSLSIMYILYE